MPYTDPEPENDPLVTVDWSLPWHAYVPAALLATGMIAAWLYHFPKGMSSWGISGAALAEGRYGTIASHMFAHGPLVHIMMNMVALVSIGGPLVARLGRPPGAWLRFLLLFVLSALAGTSLFLALHPHGTVPMLGASGALYGLLGLLLRLPPEPGPLQPLRSPRMRRAVIAMIKENLWLFALLILPGLLLAGHGGLAWEAHLGGLLFGLLVGPRLLPEWTGEAAGEPDSANAPLPAAAAGD